MNGNLAAAFVVNASFYLLVQVTRFFLGISGGNVAWYWPERGPMWFASCTWMMIAVAFTLLVWTLLLPFTPAPHRRLIHSIITLTAALNLVFACGNHGILTAASIKDFADTPSNRARHEMRKQLIRQHHEMEQEMRRLQR